MHSVQCVNELSVVIISQLMKLKQMKEGRICVSSVEKSK